MNSLEPLRRSEQEEAEAEEWLKKYDQFGAGKENRDIEKFFE